MDEVVTFARLLHASFEDGGWMEDGSLRKLCVTPGITRAGKCTEQEGQAHGG